MLSATYADFANFLDGVATGATSPLVSPILPGRVLTLTSRLNDGMFLIGCGANPVATTFRAGETVFVGEGDLLFGFCQKNSRVSRRRHASERKQD